MARKILTADQFTSAHRAAAESLSGRVGAVEMEEALTAALASLGILTPPPTPDTNMCTAFFADPEGQWWQCQADPGHGSIDHDCGEWSWDDDDPAAIPAGFPQ